MQRTRPLRPPPRVTLPVETKAHDNNVSLPKRKTKEDDFDAAVNEELRRMQDSLQQMLKDSSGLRQQQQQQPPSFYRSPSNRTFNGDYEENEEVAARVAVRDYDVGGVASRGRDGAPAATTVGRKQLQSYDSQSNPAYLSGPSPPLRRKGGITNMYGSVDSDRTNTQAAQKAAYSRQLQQQIEQQRQDKLRGLGGGGGGYGAPQNQQHRLPQQQFQPQQQQQQQQQQPPRAGREDYTGYGYDGNSSSQSSSSQLEQALLRAKQERHRQQLEDIARRLQEDRMEDRREERDREDERGDHVYHQQVPFASAYTRPPPSRHETQPNQPHPTKPPQAASFPKHHHHHHQLSILPSSTDLYNHNSSSFSNKNKSMEDEAYAPSHTSTNNYSSSNTYTNAPLPSTSESNAPTQNQTQTHQRGSFTSSEDPSEKLNRRQKQNELKRQLDSQLSSKLPKSIPHHLRTLEIDEIEEDNYNNNNNPYKEKPNNHRNPRENKAPPAVAPVTGTQFVRHYRNKMSSLHPSYESSSSSFASPTASNKLETSNNANNSVYESDEGGSSLGLGLHKKTAMVYTSSSSESNYREQIAPSSSSASSSPNSKSPTKARLQLISDVYGSGAVIALGTASSDDR